MSERRREAHKSLDVLELIETSANMGRRECECICPACVFLPPFIDSRRDELHAWEIHGAVLFSPNRGRTVGRSYRRRLWGMSSGVVVILENLLTVLETCPCPVAPVVGMVMAVERAVLRV